MLPLLGVCVLLLLGLLLIAVIWWLLYFGFGDLGVLLLLYDWICLGRV